MIKRAASISFIVLLILGTFVANTGFTSTATLETDKLREQITTLAKVVILQEKEIQELRVQIGEMKLASKDDKVVLYTVEMLTKGACPSRWADPTHIKTVIAAAKKYEYLVKGVSYQEHANWQFIMARCLATGLDPNFHCDNDGNKMWDNGVGDLNDCILADTEKRLPKELRVRSWFNIEKSVAGLYVWIARRDEMRMPWCELNYEQWQYYAKIKHL